MKLRRIISLSVAMFFVCAVAYAAGSSTNQYGDPCELIKQLGGVFRTLKTLAYLGAAFVLVGWAWTFISAGYDATGTKLDDAKKKAIGFIVGFSLLFGLAMVLQFLPGTMGCQDAWNSWNSSASSSGSQARPASAESEIQRFYYNHGS